MKKVLIAAVAAVIVVGGSAVAYKAYARYDGWGHGRHHSRMSAADMTAFAEARIAALRAGLTLNAEQEKLWPPVETALRELAAKRVERHEQFRAERRERAGRRDEDRAERRDRDRDDRRAEERQERRNPVERLRRGGERLSELGAGLTRLAEATEPLYNSLDDAQKRRFDALAHAGMRHMGGMHRHREGRGWRRSGEFDGSRDFRRGGHHRDGGRSWHERIEWTDPLPQDVERL